MDQVAFRDFYHKTAPALRAYIARSAGSVDLADDILQDVFMRFLLNPRSQVSEAAMRGYLYRTAETLIVDRWRQRQREHRRDQAAAELLQVTEQLDYSDDINRAFRDLKPQQRSLLWMAYVEEFAHREIASAAGLREGSVRVLLSRARKAFAVAVNKLGLGQEGSDVK